jgi:hypothetical protein
MTSLTGIWPWHLRQVVSGLTCLRSVNPVSPCAWRWPKIPAPPRADHGPDGRCCSAGSSVAGPAGSPGAGDGRCPARRCRCWCAGTRPGCRRPWPRGRGDPQLVFQHFLVTGEALLVRCRIDGRLEMQRAVVARNSGRRSIGGTVRSAVCRASLPVPSPHAEAGIPGDENPLDHVVHGFIDPACLDSPGPRATGAGRNSPASRVIEGGVPGALIDSGSQARRQWLH